MRNSLRLIAVSVALWFGSGVGIANAEIFDGNSETKRPPLRVVFLTRTSSACY